jgi:hypothetical protein
MPRASRLEQDFSTAQRTFNTVTSTVGGLYLATHSVIVTLAGAAAGSLLTCWALWLAHRREEVSAGQKSLSSNDESDRNSTSDTHLPRS